ncbi:zinc transporter protein [Biomphalaria pfeifferi]|uniref:Zinc transporter protein n=1 Tax=Biomphalaria pfeifferi TaxID=112525 RepID=A0AAD8B8N0_BIOPF|nr:zinc transporter protein [Biomphalaria pfeifferi]
MAMENTVDDKVLAIRPEVTSTTASSIYIRWALEGMGSGLPKGFVVQYNRIASNYFQYSEMLEPSTETYGIKNLVADTYYKVCVKMFVNESLTLEECLEASTTSWHIPVSIGSSIGAVLALSIIVLIVLLSRCPNLVHQPRTAAAESSKYDSMSSHFPDDRYEMSDTTTHCQDHERDEDVFSQNSEGDSLTDTKALSRHHHSPQSLAERVCNGSKLVNGLGKPSRSNIPLGRCGRTLSLTEKRHATGHPYRTRQARLAHMHTHFHSIQSEPGSLPVRAAPRISITDLPATAHGSDLASSRNRHHHSSMPSTHVANGKTSLVHGSHSKVNVNQRDTPRLISKTDSATSASDPTVAEATTSRIRPPVLKYISKTLHMSIEGDTLV